MMLLVLKTSTVSATGWPGTTEARRGMTSTRISDLRSCSCPRAALSPQQQSHQRSESEDGDGNDDPDEPPRLGHRFDDNGFGLGRWGRREHHRLLDDRMKIGTAADADRGSDEVGLCAHW